ncbi:MAG: glycosyltransferase [Flavobacteriales bacterium]|nr:glycosyltransferase [Flavobacteriales bacterium]
MKILVLLSRFPYPLEKGDKLRVFHQIKELSEKHEIYLCALSDEPVSKENYDVLKKYCVEIEVIRLFKVKIFFNLIHKLIFTKKSLQVSYFYNKSAQDKVNKFIEKVQPDYIYCQLIRVTEYVRHSKIPKTLDYMDALARGMERRIEEAPFYLKPFLKIETERLKRYEHFIFNDFNHHTIISKQDKELIVNIKNDSIVVVQNGVDYSTYQFKDAEKKYDLIFTGNMSYPPNITSAIYIVKEIMPLIWNQNPTINIAIVGSNPDSKITALKSDKVIVTGWVDDISSYYSESKIFIAPMQIGTGLQNKLLEAMAMKLPCITSNLANNALGAEHNKNILIGNSSEEYANHVLSLLENKELYITISENGHQYVKQHFTWEGTTQILEQLITSK